MICPKCKSNNPNEARFCYNCGFDFQQMNNCLVKAKENNGMIWLIRIIGIFTPLIALIMLFVSKTPKDERRRKRYIIVLIIWAIVQIFIMITNGSNSTSSKNVDYGKIEDFSYETDGDVIKLEKYKGRCKILEIQPTYEIDGVTYTTDLSDFQIREDRVETFILQEGIKSINISAFNGCEVKKVFYPSTMELVEDSSLAYLDHRSDDSKIQIYYAGTEEEWNNIFTAHQRKKLSETESAEEAGASLAEKANELLGAKYDESKFEYHFSASPDELKK